jgi:4-hydroxy-tetrahydrodipicolinate synthase
MSLPGRFGGVITAMATPFALDGSLDVDGAVHLARWLVDNGTEGLLVAGTTGESPVLSDTEKVELWQAVAEAMTVPVIAGSGSNDTCHSVELTRRAEEAGVDGVLTVTPYYNRPSQAGIGAHFRAIAAATSLPVVLYDIPVRTGRKLGHELLVSLARDVPNIVGVKDAAGDLVASARFMAEVGDRLDVYSGDSSLTLPLLAVGAAGVIGVATHWSGPEHAEMLAAFAAGDVRRARQLNARLLESYAFEGSDMTPNPMPVKAMLRVLGLPAGQCRQPIGEAPEQLDHQARQVLSRLRREGREERVARSGEPVGG